MKILIFFSVKYMYYFNFHVPFGINNRKQKLAINCKFVNSAKRGKCNTNHIY